MAASEQTKQRIAQGMKELLEERPFEDISVGDIAKHCQISRNTVYYHFKDKYDIVSWLFHWEITPLMGDSAKIGHWAEGLLAVCAYMQRNRGLYMKLLQIEGQNSFSQCLMDFYANVAQNIILDAGGGQLLTPQQVRSISRFYAFGLTGVISNWAKAGMEDDPRPTVQTLQKVFSGEIFEKLLALQPEEG